MVLYAECPVREKIISRTAIGQGCKPGQDLCLNKDKKMTGESIQFELNTSLDIEYAVRDFIEAHCNSHGFGPANEPNVEIRGDAREAAAHIARLEAIRQIIDHVPDGNLTKCLTEISNLMDQFVRKHALIGYASTRKIAKAEHNDEVLALLSASVSTESVLEQEVFA